MRLEVHFFKGCAVSSFFCYSTAAKVRNVDLCLVLLFEIEPGKVEVLFVKELLVVELVTGVVGVVIPGTAIFINLTAAAARRSLVKGIGIEVRVAKVAAAKALAVAMATTTAATATAKSTAPAATSTTASTSRKRRISVESNLKTISKSIEKITFKPEYSDCQTDYH